MTATPDAEAPVPTANNFASELVETQIGAQLYELAREANRLRQVQHDRFELIQVAEDAYQEAKRAANAAQDRLNEALRSIQ